MIFRIKPVSYTHLDVYKRQSLNDDVNHPENWMIRNKEPYIIHTFEPVMLQRRKFKKPRVANIWSAMGLYPAA